MVHTRSRSDGSAITVAATADRLPSPPLPSISPPRNRNSRLTTKQNIALIRRVLCTKSPPTTPIEEILPALTSSSAIDVEIYSFIAIICRDFVYAWYQKITTDNEFVDEIVQVLAHCTRSLEQRLRSIDLETLCLDDIPALLENHIKDYRLARERQSTSFSPYATVNDIFHNIQPHPALSSPPESERIYLKLVGSGILSVLLPTEDLQSDCERTLVTEILSSLVLWNAVDKLSEPHILFELVGKIFNVLNNKPASWRPDETVNSPKTPAENKNASKELTIKSAGAGGLSGLKSNAVSFVVDKMEAIFSFSTNVGKVARFVGGRVFSFIQNGSVSSSSGGSLRRSKSILQMSLFRFLKTFTSLDQRQPWLLGGLQFVFYPLCAKEAGSWVDRLLADTFQELVVREDLVVQILRLARGALFPNDALGPPQPPPSEAEKTAIQRRAEEAIWQFIPQAVKSVYFPPRKQEQLREISESLAFLKSRTCNKHLIYHVLDLLVARLLPELVDEAPSRLKDSRVRN